MDGAGLGRRQRDHRLPRHAVHRRDRADADPTGTAATTFTVTGLTNGTAYTFTVAAINAVGTGADSAACAAITPPARPRPARRPASAGTAGDASVALSWTAPASNGGSAITGYRVTPYIGTTAQTAILTGSAATTLHRHRPHERHGVHVQGRGDQRGRHRRRLGRVAPRSRRRPRRRRARRRASAAPRATRSVALSWTAPASNGGSAITGYRVTPYIGATAQTAILTGSAATTYTVTGLTNGTAYTFTVAAINAVGTGADSAASAAITPVAPPPAKTVVSIEFDDNIATQFQTLAMLQAHGMRATFYVNSGITPTTSNGG